MHPLISKPAIPCTGLRQTCRVTDSTGRYLVIQKFTGRWSPIQRSTELYNHYYLKQCNGNIKTTGAGMMAGAGAGAERAGAGMGSMLMLRQLGICDAATLGRDGCADVTQLG